MDQRLTVFLDVCDILKLNGVSTNVLAPIFFFT